MVTFPVVGKRLMCEAAQAPTLWERLSPYAQEEQLAILRAKDADLAAYEEDFLKRVSKIVETPDLTAREQLIDQLMVFIGLLPGLFQPRLTQYYAARDRILSDILQEVRVRIWQEFTPTGKVVVRCLTKWINEKLRLKYRLLDEYGKNSPDRSYDDFINSDSERRFEDFLADPTLSGIDAWLAQEFASQQVHARYRSRQFWNYLEADPDDILRNRLIPGANGRNHHELVQRLFLSNPPYSRTEIAREFGMGYPRFISHLNRHFYPKLYCLPLEANLLTLEMAEIVKAEISNHQGDQLQRCHLSVAFTKLNAQFLALRRLRIFREVPMTFAEIIREPEVSEYITQKRTGNFDQGKAEALEEQIKAFWEDKCCPLLGNIAKVSLQINIEDWS